MQALFTIGGALVMITCLAACRPARDAAPPSTGGRAQELVDLEHRWVRLSVAGDLAGLADLMADDYIAVGSDGGTLDRTARIDAVRSTATTYDAVLLSNLSVSVYGSTGIVTGRHSHGSISTTGIVRGAGSYTFINTWTRIDGRWQLVGSGLSPLDRGVATIGRWQMAGDGVGPLDHGAGDQADNRLRSERTRSSCGTSPSCAKLSRAH